MFRLCVSSYKKIFFVHTNGTHTSKGADEMHIVIGFVAGGAIAIVLELLAK
ncbi:hypothetical protein [Pseudalkalibacillus sp. R45]|uniref:hypothetical protein n=1 Tax=Pseudalkalibacillus sp. R45 TaxID=3457433 RepID=UPI003FCCDFC0